jgi:uncharacterized coiled-coil DUF342 family protein
MVEDKGDEGKWKDLMDKLSSIEDLQNLTQLDIINLKNEIEKMRLTSTSPVPPEIEQKIVELEGIARDVDVFKKWKDTIAEVKFLRSKIIGFPKPPKPSWKKEESGKEGIEEIGEIRKEIGEIRKELKTKKFPSRLQIDITGLRTAVQENMKTIETLKSMISEKPRAIPDLDSMRKMINENRRLVEELKSKARASPAELPTDVHGEIESLHNELTKLESEIKLIKEEETRKAREEKPEAGEVTEGAGDEIDSLRKELYTKLDELNLKFETKGSEDIKNTINANRANIENLKKLLFQEISGRGEEDTGDVKTQIEDNRKSIEELKNLLSGRKPEAKTVLPLDPALRKKMLQIEQRVSSLGRKLEKMNTLKPIKIPKMQPPAAGGKVTKGMDLEIIKKDVDSILSKMDDFVTKNDIKKGFVEKRMKADEKLVKDDTYKELNEIKKTILRNEDHINNLVSDVEGLKKEVGTVEKREWGKVKEMPDLEELRHRIEEIERKLKTTQTGLLLIE